MKIMDTSMFLLDNTGAVSINNLVFLSVIIIEVIFSNFIQFALFYDQFVPVIVCIQVVVCQRGNDLVQGDERERATGGV